MPQLHTSIAPEILNWALDRSGKTPDALAHKFPKLNAWQSGEAAPTFRQLEHFAKATYTPIGFFFLPEPPIEELPIPDFRTVGGAHIRRPSPNLLDTIYACQQRQAWYQDFARITGESPLPFAGSASLSSSVQSVARAIAQTLNFDLNHRSECRTWEDALSYFASQADEAGILVMSSGIVGTHTRRKLEPEEFRGFALADALAPVVFINAADTKSARMFTLAHELAHIWLGQSALTDASLYDQPSGDVERWCNAVAAELLVPLEVLRADYTPGVDLADALLHLARRFKVSSLVILRRMLDAALMSRPDFERAYRAEAQRLHEILEGRASGGGDFYRNQQLRVSRRFARALIVNTLEGQTLFRDAQQMLGVKKMETFMEMGRKLQVVL